MKKTNNMTIIKHFFSLPSLKKNLSTTQPYYKDEPKPWRPTDLLSNNRVKKEFEHFFLKGDLEDSISPNRFKKNYLTYYKSNLYKVLDDNNIASVVIRVRTQAGDTHTLGTQFGYKFNYDEMNNWNFAKSPYQKILWDYYQSLMLKKKSNLLIKSFDYKFTELEAPLNLDQFFTRFVGELLDYWLKYEDTPVEFYYIVFSKTSKESDHSTPVKTLSSIPLKKNITNLKNVRKSFQNSLLPLTLDESTYGRRGYSTRVYIDDINKVKRVVTDLSPTSTKKEVYSLETGASLEKYIDEKISEDSFVRRNIKNNSSLTIKNNEIVKTCLNVELPIISRPMTKKTENSFNKNIGSFDVETYHETNSDKTVVYSLGFCYGGNNIKINKPTSNMYYIDEALNSDDLVLQCINDMLKPKYKKTIFYTHNLGGYDVVYVLKILANYNKKCGNEYYKLEAVLKDKRILKLKISVKISKSSTNTIFLVDSLSLLPMSLASLCKGFKSDYEKGFFPYSFVTEKTLFYEGVTPSIEYYHTHKDNISLENYQKLVKNDWSLKKETLKYLDNDLLSLLGIMYEFSNYVFENHSIQVSECLTITGLALKLFLTHFYLPTSKSLALLTNKSIYSDIKNAYYGGLSEVYKGYGENLYYYDVNSLYPYAALNDMPGNECKYIESLNGESLDIYKDKLFGFFYCEVKSNKNDYFGSLPFRQLGVLTYPVGEFSGWFFSPQIEYAIKQGYEIKIIKGYSFNRVKEVFNGYVESVYKEKEENTGAKRLIAKLLLNGLLGRFGMHLEKKITSLTTDIEKRKNLKSKYEVYGEIPISENLVLVTHSQNISKVICSQHGIDYFKALTKDFKLIDEKNSNFVSVGISAAVTSYSSIFMLNIKKLLLSLGGEIYYTDTDSIVTNIPLPKEYIGDKLGEFKLEYMVKRGYFISSKLYCLVIQDGDKEKEIIKSKGVYGCHLNEEDFKKLLRNEKISHGVKGSSSKNYAEGYVTIKTKNNININPGSYRKREKIYEDDIWSDTKALEMGDDNENNDNNE